MTAFFFFVFTIILLPLYIETLFFYNLESMNFDFNIVLTTPGILGKLLDPVVQRLVNFNSGLSENSSSNCFFKKRLTIL